MKALLKKVYHLFPFKKEIFMAIKFISSPPKNIYKHLHFNGIISVKMEKSKSFKLMHYGYQIENSLFWEGITNGWEKESMKWWTKLCAESQTILDIGANTGVYAVVANCVNPNAKILAFEPIKNIFKKLEYNNQLNNSAIKCYEAGLSNYTGTAKIYPMDLDHVYSVTVNKNLADESVKVFEQEINVLTLQKVIEDNQLTKIDLIKLDVETHEVEVLEGFGYYLKTMKPAMLIEILNDKVAAGVEALITGMNYLYFNISEEGETIQQAHLGKSKTFNFLICDESTAKKIGVIN